MAVSSIRSSSDTSRLVGRSLVIELGSWPLSVTVPLTGARGWGLWVEFGLVERLWFGPFISCARTPSSDFYYGQVAGVCMRKFLNNNGLFYGLSHFTLFFV